MARDDKRDTDRAKRRVMVRYGIEKTDKRGYTRNMSPTGLFIGTNTVFKPDSTIQVTLEFKERTFSMWARVVWAKKVPPQLAHVLDCGMGVCFIDPPAEWFDFVVEWQKSRPGN